SCNKFTNGALSGGVSVTVKELQKGYRESEKKAEALTRFFAFNRSSKDGKEEKKEGLSRYLTSAAFVAMIAFG
ncbi:MAG: hypothetical protein MHPSP_002337, partial [Paramarteilia canceri]